MRAAEGEAERTLLAADVYSHALASAAMPAWYHSLDLLLHPSFDAETRTFYNLEDLWGDAQRVNWKRD